MNAPGLSTRWGPLELDNPVVISSGTHGLGEEGVHFYPPEMLGAVISKTVTLEPREGNPPPRIAETPCGMLNSIGLANPGIDVYESEIHGRLLSLGPPVIVNIAGFTRDEYRMLASRVNGLPSVAAIEVNVSCPNVERGGMVVGTSPEETFAVLEGIVGETDLPVAAKLTPNVTDIAAIGRAALEAGAHMLSVVNTLVGMSIDIEKRRSNLGMMTGGLSGPAMHPVGLAHAWRLVQGTGASVLGGGGVVSAEGALAYLIAGASAVGVGTATFVDPCAPVRILEGISDYLERHGFTSLDPVIGSLSES